MADPTATPRTFTEEELSKMPPGIRENILAALAIMNATPTPTPTPGVKKPPITRASSPPKIPTPAPTKKALVEGVDFVYNEYGDIVTKSDPEFANYAKLWRARSQSGID